jgi:hypothetical protein
MQTKTFFCLAVGLVLAACAAPSAEEDDPVASDDALTGAKSTCTPAAYHEAFLRYRNAVHDAQVRTTDACAEGTSIYDLATDLGASVATCPDFEQVIATSKWAAPVRAALAGNVAIPILTGKLRVRGPQAFVGLGEALPGVTIYGPAPGVLGNVSRITFAAGGKASFTARTLDDDGNVVEKAEPAAWTVVKSGAKVSLAITVSGETTLYELSAPDGEKPWERPAMLELRPAAGDAFSSVPDECDI